jgi:hypothetical protein
MAARDVEFKIQVPIIDNNIWEPDMDFFIEMYDLKTDKCLLGDDTQCKVTILDEDCPGVIGFL